LGDELTGRSERAHTTQSDIRLLLLLFSRYRYRWRDVLHGIGTWAQLVHQAHIHTQGNSSATSQPISSGLERKK
jgi:hypothetical protein